MNIEHQIFRNENSSYEESQRIERVPGKASKSSEQRRKEWLEKEAKEKELTDWYMWDEFAKEQNLYVDRDDNNIIDEQ